jgi:excisionase family DNA binding protein
VEKWLTRPEVADWLRVPVDTVATWAAHGTGPRYVKVGRHTRYRLSDLEKWLETRAQEQGASR